MFPKFSMVKKQAYAWNAKCNHAPTFHWLWKNEQIEYKILSGEKLAG